LYDFAIPTARISPYSFTQQPGLNPTAMALNSSEKKQFKAIAHHLNPVIIVGEKGLSEGLISEVERALLDHELIKVKIAIADRDSRTQLTSELIDKTNAELVQTIGKIAVLLKRNPRPNPKLSNLLRH
jgi:RNA-binding protein